jgi:hypothetical protein
MMGDGKEDKVAEMTAEKFETLSAEEADGKDGLHQTQTMGAVTITDMEEIYLVPAPSADPRGKHERYELLQMPLTFSRSFEST